VRAGRASVILPDVPADLSSPTQATDQKLTKAPTLISIVEDDPSVSESLAEFIEFKGYDTATFASAERFLSSKAIHSTACLITDLHLPGMDGAELQQFLISEGFQIPIIFMSAGCSHRVRASVMKAGATEFFDKPFSMAALIECLGRVLRRSA
jgi:FixJ family two-component response regulator